ncbi:MAG: pyridoxamine 5'-phosphate oxidase family protein [Pseudomonadota bacterium]
MENTALQIDTLTPALRNQVQDILRQGQDLTLATLRPDGYPQATTLSYASVGLTLYACVGIDSQKAHNIRQDKRVSLTINLPYADWQHIKGLSMAAHACIVSESEEMQRAASALQQRFPQFATAMPGGEQLPWAGTVFIKIVPEVISVLDYTQGFGHTDLARLPGQTATERS